MEHDGGTHQKETHWTDDGLAGTGKRYLIKRINNDPDLAAVKRRRINAMHAATQALRGRQPKKKKAATWSKEEDEFLVQWVKSYGPVDWNTCAAQLKTGRTGDACRQHYGTGLRATHAPRATPADAAAAPVAAAAAAPVAAPAAANVPMESKKRKKEEEKEEPKKLQRKEREEEVAAA